MSDRRSGGADQPVAVMVELRVPAGLSAAVHIEDAGLSATGFALDTSYEPVPLTPTPEQAGAIEAAGEELVIVRGSIAEDRIAELEARKGIVKVWRDTVVEPFGF